MLTRDVTVIVCLLILIQACHACLTHQRTCTPNEQYWKMLDHWLLVNGANSHHHGLLRLMSCFVSKLFWHNCILIKHENDRCSQLFTSTCLLTLTSNGKSHVACEMHHFLDQIATWFTACMTELISIVDSVKWCIYATVNTVINS